MSQLALTFSLDDAESRDTDFSTSARRWIVELPPGQRFDSDILRRYVGEPGGFGNSVGAVISRCRDAGLIFATGERRRSVRPSARGRGIDVWQRTER